MKKVSLWSLAILILLLIYFAATIIFSYLFQGISDQPAFANTPTPGPTFTATSPPTAIVIAATPIPVDPTFTPTATIPATQTMEPTVPATEAPVTATAPALGPQPQVVAVTTVNIRSGPGTNYPVIATLPPNVTLPIIGQNQAGTWWQIEGPAGEQGWVAASVVVASEVAGVPVPVVEPPAQPTAVASVPTAAPAEPPLQAASQYTPSGWFDDTNHGLTRFLGTITDVNGNPVNEVQVEARCGDFKVLSNPSGTTGWPAGFYDLTLDTKPVPCSWFLTVVTSADGKTASGSLSESIEAVVTYDKSIITANWIKNW